jgi:hypothetical protein
MYDSESSPLATSVCRELPIDHLKLGVTSLVLHIELNWNFYPSFFLGHFRRIRGNRVHSGGEKEGTNYSINYIYLTTH